MCKEKKNKENINFSDTDTTGILLIHKQSKELNRNTVLEQQSICFGCILVGELNYNA